MKNIIIFAIFLSGCLNPGTNSRKKNIEQQQHFSVGDESKIDEANKKYTEAIDKTTHARVEEEKYAHMHSDEIEGIGPEMTAQQKAAWEKAEEHVDEMVKQETLAHYELLKIWLENDPNLRPEARKSIEQKIKKYETIFFFNEKVEEAESKGMENPYAYAARELAKKHRRGKKGRQQSTSLPTTSEQSGKPTNLPTTSEQSGEANKSPNNRKTIRRSQQISQQSQNNQGSQQVSQQSQNNQGKQQITVQSQRIQNQQAIQLVPKSKQSKIQTGNKCGTIKEFATRYKAYLFDFRKFCCLDGRWFGDGLGISSHRRRDIQ